MSTSELSTSNTIGITLTVGGADTSPFTISPSGQINALAFFGVYSAIAAPILLNQGYVTAEATSVEFLNGGTVVNQGTIDGAALAAIYLKEGGLVTNAGTGFIGGEIEVGTATGTLVNTGTVHSTEYFGIILGGGGAVTNSAEGAVVYGADVGVLVTEGSGNVSNFGMIVGLKSEGIALDGGGTINNNGVSSYIKGLNEGAGISNAVGTITNGGTIISTSGAAVDLGDGGLISNTGSILDRDLSAAFVSNAVGTIINSGIIVSSFGVGADLTDGGFIFNTGSISGGQCGVAISGAVATVDNSGVINGTSGAGVQLIVQGTVINSGTISGDTFSVSFDGAGNNRLIVEPDAVFNGTVYASSFGSNTIEFGAGKGRLTGIGSQITGFSTLTFDTGATWFVGGALSALSAEAIDGFAVHDIIDLTGFTIARTETLALGANGQLSIPQVGSAAGTLDFVGIATGTIFYAISDQTGGTEIFTGSAPCFCAGTRITTPRGPVAVENLKIGDAVKTLHGGVQKIKWIGERHYDGRFIAGNHHALPVRIRRHALGFNVPSRDLYVSPDHAICEGGMLIHAWRLINGVSITQEDAVDSVSYFHIELEKHDILFANNVPAESFLNENCRDRFQNAAEFAEKFPEAEKAQTPCLPRLESGFYLHRIQTRLAARAGVKNQPVAIGPLRGFIDECSANRLRGWAQNVSAPEVPVELEILGADGSQIGRILANGYRPDLRAAGLGSGCHGFSVPLPPGFYGAVTVRRIADQQPLLPTEVALAQAA